MSMLQKIIIFHCNFIYSIFSSIVILFIRFFFIILVASDLCNFDCLNGGRCGQYGFCECAQGFLGPRCEKCKFYMLQLSISPEWLKRRNSNAKQKNHRKKIFKKFRWIFFLPCIKWKLYTISHCSKIGVFDILRDIDLLFKCSKL